MKDLLDSLKIDPMVLGLNIVLFLAVVIILDRLFWKPMMRHLDGRKDRISDAYRTVDETRKEMERLRTDYQARLTEIEAEARGRIQETVRDAQHQREQMVAEARAQAERVLAESAHEIEREQAQTAVTIRGGLSKVAAGALASVIGIPANAVQLQLVEEHIAKKSGRS